MDTVDLTTTATGASAGMTIIATTDWAQVPHGQCVRLGVGLLLILFGYFMYRPKK